MRTVIQKVSHAGVSIKGSHHASIGPGLLVFLGIETGDDTEDADWLAGKVARLRVFKDTQGIMNLSVQDVAGDLLVISQFTLHASTKKGNRPAYIHAARPEQAIPLYERFIAKLEEESGRTVASGNFGAMMQVSLENDGPVTILIDSKLKW